MLRFAFGSSNLSEACPKQGSRSPPFSCERRGAVAQERCPFARGSGDEPPKAGPLCGPALSSAVPLRPRCAARRRHSSRGPAGRGRARGAVRFGRCSRRGGRAGRPRRGADYALQGAPGRRRRAQAPARALGVVLRRRHRRSRRRSVVCGGPRAQVGGGAASGAAGPGPFRCAVRSAALRLVAGSLSRRGGAARRGEARGWGVAGAARGSHGRGAGEAEETLRVQCGGKPSVSSRAPPPGAAPRANFLLFHHPPPRDGRAAPALPRRDWVRAGRAGGARRGVRAGNVRWSQGTAGLDEPWLRVVPPAGRAGCRPRAVPLRAPVRLPWVRGARRAVPCRAPGQVSAGLFASCLRPALRQGGAPLATRRPYKSRCRQRCGAFGAWSYLPTAGWGIKELELLGLCVSYSFFTEISSLAVACGSGAAYLGIFFIKAMQAILF